jgi:LmbE family N-acetylglucosaminyl deacetylase
VNVLALSPHYDDIVWSAGAHLASLARSLGGVTVVTVYAKRPPPGLLTAFDRQCGFTGDSHDAMATRRLENIRACTVVGVGDLDGPFGDSQYGDAVSEEDIAAWLTPLVRDTGRILAPLGLGHPDHRRVGAAVRRVALRERVPLTVYEEIPARVWDPPEPVHIIDTLTANGWGFTPAAFDVPTDAHYATKASAAACYGSQLDEPIRRVLTVPERLWDVQGPAR